MSSTRFVVEYPERESYGEVMKGYFSLMRGFGLEFENRCNRMLGAEFGVGWFMPYIKIRREQGRVKGHVDLNDPSFFLGDYLWRDDTIFKKVLSSESSARIAAKKILDVRNTWLHFSEEPTTSDLEEAAKFIREFAETNKMTVAVPAAALIKRIGRIKTGQYPPVVKPSADAPAPPASEDPQPNQDGGEAPPDIVLDAPAPGSRPPIGGTWSGDIPAKQVKVTRTGDVVDIETGESMRSSIEGVLAEKVRQWTSARPNGPLWVDTDGAVGGYVQGVARLLGYTGADPEGEIARGFLLPRYYDVREGHVVDLDSGVALTDAVTSDATRESLKAADQAVVDVAAPGGTIRVTTFGDVIYLDDDGMRRLAVVTPATWFPGHFAV